MIRHYSWEDIKEFKSYIDSRAEIRKEINRLNSLLDFEVPIEFMITMAMAGVLVSDFKDEKIKRTFLNNLQGNLLKTDNSRSDDVLRDFMSILCKFHRFSAVQTKNELFYPIEQVARAIINNRVGHDDHSVYQALIGHVVVTIQKANIFFKKARLSFFFPNENKLKFEENLKILLLENGVYYKDVKSCVLAYKRWGMQHEKITKDIPLSRSHQENQMLKNMGEMIHTSKRVEFSDIVIICHH